MAFATSVAVSKGALVAPSETFDKRTTIFSRQIRTPSSFKNARQGYSPLSVKCFKGLVVPKPGLLDKVTNGLPSIISKPDEVKRKDFPADFYFGCSTSALQTEGPGTEGGRGPSTWDQFIRDESGQEVPAVDSYNRYKEDVKDLKKMGVNAYRFSIGWPRILPDGTLRGGVNKEGIDFYNRFIDELLDNGITPIVTLTHFDLPQALQDKYKGFLSSRIVDDFKDYADVCFKNFGDRVKHWSTINEPQVFAQFGYVMGLPEGYKTLPTDPFLAAHNIILSHAAAAKVYKEKYQKSQKGEIGISLVTQWFKPHSESRHDKDASERAFDFLVGWFLEPLMYGDYPFIMKALVKDGLPEFTEEQKAMVKGSFDYIGVNYYTSRFAKDIPYDPETEYETSDAYQHALLSLDNAKGELIGEKAPGSEEIYVYPDGLRDALIYISKEYGNPKIYITENGYPEKRDDNLSVDKACQDDDRIDHITAHLYAIKEAMKEGANVKGYFMWALMDCMEMGSFYNVRFGLYYTDYLNDLARIPKKSADWMKSFMKH